MIWTIVCIWIFTFNVRFEAVLWIFAFNLYFEYLLEFVLWILTRIHTLNLHFEYLLWIFTLNCYLTEIYGRQLREWNSPILKLRWPVLMESFSERACHSPGLSKNKLIVWFMRPSRTVSIHRTTFHIGLHFDGTCIYFYSFSICTLKFLRICYRGRFWVLANINVIDQLCNNDLFLIFTVTWSGHSPFNWKTHFWKVVLCCMVTGHSGQCLVAFALYF